MLNFDPHQWLRHRRFDENLAGLAGLAEDLSKAEDEESSKQSTKPAKVAKDAPASLRSWHRHLSALDDCAAPLGFSLNRWQLLCDDACWIYENFASVAVRNGWSANDLFGVLPWHRGWGGLCDRLDGARNLKMDDCRAAWSHFGVRDWTCPGAGDDLVPSGLVPIWEIGRA